jgi:hypothetical protein
MYGCDDSADMFTLDSNGANLKMHALAYLFIRLLVSCAGHAQKVVAVHRISFLAKQVSSEPYFSRSSFTKAWACPCNTYIGTVFASRVSIFTYRHSLLIATEKLRIFLLDDGPAS